MDDPELDNSYSSDSESSVPASIIPKVVESVASTFESTEEHHIVDNQLNGELLPCSSIGFHSFL